MLLTPINSTAVQDGKAPARMHISSTPHLSLRWSDVFYDIPLAKRKKLAFRRHKDDGKHNAAGNGAVETVTETPALATEHRRILSGVSGSVNKGELVAILGASGAGKTTLLNIISARVSSVGILHGKVLFHDKPRDPKSWKRTVGFVEQEDVMLGNLTVQETLGYAARMRLPDKLYTRKEKVHRVEDTIDMLRLQQCRDTRIGTSTERGISGGERKRTSIGVELVSDVSLLLLDEPTSGLDAYAAYSVVENLRDTTRSRELSCLMTIHQPSWALLKLVDRVQLLAQGKVYYEGPPMDMLAWFSGLGYVVPEGANPADYYITLAETGKENDEGEREDQQVQQLIEAWAKRGEAAAAGSSQQSSASCEQKVTEDDALLDAYKSWPTAWSGEIATLIRRNVTQMARDRDTLFGVLGQTIIVLLLLGFAFFRLGRSQADVLARIGVLFFLVINTSFSVSFPVLTPFPNQRAVMIRERSAGTYRASSFYLSKLLVEVPTNVVQQAPFFFIFYWMVGLKASAGPYFIFLGIAGLQIVVSVCFGLFIGSVSRSIEIANIIAPMFSIIFLLFGGNLLPSPPPWFIWLHYISPLTYSYMALAQNEFRGETFTCTGSGSQCYRTGEQVLEQYHLYTFTIGECAGFLLAIAFVLVIMGYVGLRITAHPRFRYL